MVNVRRLAIATLSVTCGLLWIMQALRVGTVGMVILLIYMFSECIIGVVSYWYTPAVFSSAVLRGADAFLFIIYFIAITSIGTLIPSLLELLTLATIILWFNHFLSLPARHGYKART